MKIISVHFANLNSLPGPFLIRFDATPLADTGLFAITGPTGAGKSTLLDAIAVGLYGRVPRHDRQVGEMVSRHAGFAFSEVEFEVHETNADTGTVARVRYRSRWEVKRKTRGDDKGGLGQDAMTLVLSPSGAAVASGKETVPARVSELSGLDFGQFEQSVLLSQGKFARFLHAPEKERSALLEKMTNVGIYSRLSVAAFEKAKAEELATKLLRAQLDATRLLADDERGALEARLDALHEEAEGHYEQQQELHVFQTWRTILDQLERQAADADRQAGALHRADAALQPEFARLAGHLRAKDLAAPLALAAEAEKALGGDAAQHQQQEETLPRLAQAVAAAAERVAADAAAHAAALAEESRLRPQLEEAGKQDAAIAVAQQELAKKSAAHAQAQCAHEQARTDLARQAQEIEALATETAALDRWLIDHSPEADLKNQLLALDREIIDLQGAQKETAVREARRDELRIAQRTTGADLFRQHSLETEALDRQRAIKEEGQPCRTERDALLAGTTAPALAQRADDLTAHWQGLQQLLPKAEAAHEHHARAGALAAQAAEEAPILAAAEAALGHLETRRADGLRLLDSYRRELRAQQALADLNAHRQHLRPGQPCALCGAREHVFAPDFSAEADEQELRVTQQQQALAALDDDLRRAAHDLARRQAAQQQRQQLRQEAAAAAEVARQQAADLAGALTPPPAQPADPAAVRALLGAAATAQGTAVADRRRLAVLDDKLAALREKYLKAGEAATAAQREIPRLLDRQTATGAELVKLEDELVDWYEQADVFQNAIRELLRPHRLTLPARPPYDGVLATLAERAGFYETQVGNLEKVGGGLLELKIQYRVHAEKLAGRAGELSAEAAALAADQLAIEQRQATRQAHYAGPDPTAAAGQLRRATQQLADALQQAQHQLTSHEQALAVEQSAHATLQVRLAEHRVALATRRAELATALAAAGFADAAEARALLLPAAEADRLAQRRQDHLTARAATRTLQARLGAELAQHQADALTPLSAGALAGQLAELHKADDILQQQLGAISNQLAQDDAARRLLADGLRQLTLRQQEEQRWQDLSEQIGSAKGDKFSQFAQGLTLSHLARLANLRLRQLTGRYTILKTPNRNLELQIIDHDQADTVRPMASLSGGESFLVSLALALGLSELAGHRARIESLFIDEGFGSLDPDALNTALDALERLQHSGKMIGIISHVADLKDRIGTQIRVQPGAGGTSTVHVVGVRGEAASCAVD
ncbi:AAA family ATPase [Hymenobacter caeli]|uniref:Exonuclease SbcC n=1 Tax=Hymenobacter caeli TaxID=2735894 RepID=A0ABX2FK60_9BACT|nr:AAA family ATPase [Hymenobacter caeli]NRT17506.1 exonuclease SbcC [Hymenobacter caeli]